MRRAAGTAVQSLLPSLLMREVGASGAADGCGCCICCCRRCACLMLHVQAVVWALYPRGQSPQKFQERGCIRNTHTQPARPFR